MSSAQPNNQNDDDFIVVWIDESDVDTNHWASTRFGHATHTIRTFDDVEECIAYIQTTKNESIFLIISELFIQQCIFQFHELPQLHSIYILSSHELTSDDDYPAVHKKVRGNYSDILSLFEHLTQDIRVAEATTSPISVLNPTLISFKDLNTLDCSFIFSHLFKNIMLEFNDNVQLQQHFIGFCREKYAKNKGELKIINEFDEHYQNHSPIWWYTRECFLSKMLDKAMRMQDIDILFKMKFFLRDLHQQIEQLHSTMPTNIFHVLYRGQGLFNEQFEILKTNIHGTLSFNNFFLANSSHDISLRFAQHSLDRDNIVAVIFEIHIDPSIRSTPFISLDGIGYFPTETDILFSLHSIFRIQDVEYMNNRIWNIRLALISDNDPHLRSLTHFIQTEIQGFNSMHCLGSFMLNMHKYSKAEYIFERAHSESSHKCKSELAFIEDNLGRICYEKNDWKGSLEHYQKSLCIKLTPPTDSDPQLALTYVNLASLFKKMDIFDSAMEQYRCALNIQLKSSTPNQEQMALCYMSIGDLLCQRSNFEEARQNLKNALKIQLRVLPAVHPDLTKTRKHLFDVCCSMGDYHKALEQAKALLRIAQKSYPTNHFQLAIAHNNISVCLDKLGQYQEALEEVEKAVKIGQHTYPLGHPKMSELETLLELVRWKNAQLFDNH
ncbi:unnamed protein product [Rotaria socialis]|uniref:Tetratricopeptide SHNi-TPR domain-containing protein n=1 Tax=Rotaria socialis TaxID=392032 RepID=A0A821P4G7_9BILA|nr:unnamed protein product [Rotaria socialis]CAF4800147.1 unnamed protein product [Rotaria socialis]